VSRTKWRVGLGAWLMAGSLAAQNPPAPAAAPSPTPAQAAQPDGATGAAPTPRPPTTSTGAIATPAALPSAQEIFDKYAAAIGGRDAWKKLTSRISRGTVKIEGIDGTATLLVYERAPLDNLSMITLSNGAVVRDGVDAKGGWEQDPTGKVKSLEGARGVDSRTGANFYYEVELGKVYPHAKTMGQRTADGRLAYVVEASAPGGSLRWLYFDAETWLRFRTDIFENVLSPSPTTIERYDDYKEVDGIKFPFKASARGEGGSIDFRFTVVHHNVTVTDDEVARPISN